MYAILKNGQVLQVTENRRNARRLARVLGGVVGVGRARMLAQLVAYYVIIGAGLCLMCFVS